MFKELYKNTDNTLGVDAENGRAAEKKYSAQGY